MKCVCNAFQSEQIGIFTDKSRAIGPQVTFPEPIIEEVSQSFVALPNTIDPWIDQPGSSGSEGSSNGSSDENGSGGKVTENIAQVGEVSGSGFVWTCQSVFISTLCLIAYCMARRADGKDKHENFSISRTAPIAVAKQNHFIDEVAKELKEPYHSVLYRK